ncbi:hypothetical protein BOX15_Mlig006554g2 [Macrostomum lignano]|uniref:BTB domain-containing protein n=1 Tax=Macrostomum lignano TaxID=282301 RepID=A0A267DKA1_9PLAT|nr:hypothetical protein BOX15_Mlig006554g2 [Macrostomum lignano]
MSSSPSPNSSTVGRQQQQQHQQSQSQQQQPQHPPIASSSTVAARPRKRTGVGGSGSGSVVNLSSPMSSGGAGLDFRQDSLLFSDVTLLAGPERQRLRAHRILLSLWSPVFRAMLTNPCQEQQSQTISLPEDAPETVELMLRAIYTPGGCEIDYAGALSLLPLVHRLQVEPLVRDCEERLLRSLKDETVFAALELADRFDLGALKRYATDFCCALPVELLESRAEELGLSSETLSLILKKKIRHLQSMVEEIYLSTKRSVTRVEGKIQKVPLNHCAEHDLPRLASVDDICGQCAACTIGYLQELCSKALNKDLAHSST